MDKLDLKDRKILYQLDLNCRQSNAQIGKKVGLSKQVVDYRIKRMEKEGIINRYCTEINTLKLGYDVYRIYINFQDVSPNTKEDIIKYFASWSNAWAVISSKGPIDLNVMVWVNNSNKFHQLWNDTLEKYGAFFTKHTISVLTSGVAFKKSFLLSDEYNQDNREYFVLNNVGKNIELDNLDYQLLNEIAMNARAPITELGKKLKCSLQTINYRTGVLRFAKH